MDRCSKTTLMQREEAMHMKYEAPRVVVALSAVSSIQSGEKGHSDRLDMSFAETIGAYEADE